MTTDEIVFSVFNVLRTISQRRNDHNSENVPTSRRLTKTHRECDVTHTSDNKVLVEQRLLVIFLHFSILIVASRYLPANKDSGEVTTGNPWRSGPEMQKSAASTSFAGGQGPATPSWTGVPAIGMVGGNSSGTHQSQSRSPCREGTKGAQECGQTGELSNPDRFFL